MMTSSGQECNYNSSCVSKMWSEVPGRHPHRQSDSCCTNFQVETLLSTSSTDKGTQTRTWTKPIQQSHPPYMKHDIVKSTALFISAISTGDSYQLLQSYIILYLRRTEIPSPKLIWDSHLKNDKSVSIYLNTLEVTFYHLPTRANFGKLANITKLIITVCRPNKSAICKTVDTLLEANGYLRRSIQQRAVTKELLPMETE